MLQFYGFCEIESRSMIFYNFLGCFRNIEIMFTEYQWNISLEKWYIARYEHTRISFEMRSIWLQVLLRQILQQQQQHSKNGIGPFNHECTCNDYDKCKTIIMRQVNKIPSNTINLLICLFVCIVSLCICYAARLKWFKMQNAKQDFET